MSTINVTNLSGRGGATPNLPDGANITGVATASGGFSGTLTGTGLTTGSDGSINVTSIKTVGVSTLGNVVITGAVGGGATIGAYAGVTTFYGDGSNLTGAGDSIAPWHYNPDVGDTAIMLDELSTSGIGITFNKKVSQGSSGTATLKIVNAGAAGTTIQSWGVSSTTYNVTAFTLDGLVSDIDIDQTYQIDIPEGFVVDSGGSSYVGTAYTFTATSPVNKLWSWGYNGQGRLGDNSAIQRSSPVQIPGLGWKTLANGDPHTTYSFGATKTDGTLWRWGNNAQGQLGQNGSNVEYSSPVQVPGTTWARGSVRNNGFSAVKTDGTLWVWGTNNLGQLGQNNVIQVSSPVQIPGTTWSGTKYKIYSGTSFTGAIKTDGTLWMWGNNESGLLGINAAHDSHRSSPVQIPGTTWSKVAGGKESAYGIKTDGTLWAWGKGDEGQLGQNQPANASYSSPVQIPGTTWSQVDSGVRFVLATKTNGTLWGWGRGEVGQLGQNSVTSPSDTGYSSPIQIPGTTWSNISAGENIAHASKTDGTLWAWGHNYYGSLGLNNRTQYSSPVQITAVGNEWTSSELCVGPNAVWAIQVDRTP